MAGLIGTLGLECVAGLECIPRHVEKACKLAGSRCMAWHGVAHSAKMHGRLEGIPNCMAGLDLLPGLEGIEGLELNLWDYGGACEDF